MKCPNCGEEMAEDRLYCEHCGEDIHIVPDFEPELERNLEQSISTIMEDLQEPSDSLQPPGRMAAAVSLEKPPSKNAAQEYSTGRQSQPGKTVSNSPGGKQALSNKTAQGSLSGKALPYGKAGTAAPLGKPPAGKGRQVRRKNLLPKILLGVMVFFVIAVIVFVRMVYNYFSLDYQVGRAEQYAAAGKYDSAISCYSRALELDRGNVELTFSLAEMYLLKNNKVEYEYFLREIIHSETVTSEQLERAYGKLIVIYRDRGDYQTINDMLLASENETLMSTYQSYIARAPEFNLNEGYYTGVQPLKLTALGTGRIYFTMDGSMPTQESEQYTAPIILENGDYIITAYFVNDNGVASEKVSKEYHIQNDEIPAPQISVYSGEYYAPINIEILDGGEDVYYTMDGSDPTVSSTPYSGPIPMPLGNSIFKFVRIVDGVTGTVDEMHYRLVLNTDLTPQQAVDLITEYSLVTGKIYDKAGHFDDSGAMYYYEYQHVANINQVADFYVIAEFFQDPDVASAKTGNYFAVDVYNGTRYKLQQDNRKRYKLTEIEKEAQAAAEIYAERNAGEAGETGTDSQGQSEEPRTETESREEGEVQFQTETESHEGVEGTP